jgi:hypothetical protein
MGRAAREDDARPVDRHGSAADVTTGALGSLNGDRGEVVGVVQRRTADVLPRTANAARAAVGPVDSQDLRCAPTVGALHHPLGIRRSVGTSADGLARLEVQRAI